jgi:DNA adenine methylase
LSKIAGRFLLSVNDVPETRKFFDRFLIEPISTRYTITGQWAEAKEIVVMGPARDVPVFRPVRRICYNR